MNRTRMLAHEVVYLRFMGETRHNEARRDGRPSTPSLWRFRALQEGIDVKKAGGNIFEEVR
jgi:hypothetical protein